MKTAKFALPFALAAALAAGANAQPQSEVAEGLDIETVRVLWCGAVVHEEAHWYAEDGEYWNYFHLLTNLIDEVVAVRLEAESATPEEIAELWDSYDAAATALAEADDTLAFDSAIEKCEWTYGSLIAGDADLDGVIHCAVIIDTHWFSLDEGEEKTYYDSVLNNLHDIGVVWAERQGISYDALTGLAEPQLDVAEALHENDPEAFGAELEGCLAVFGHLGDQPEA